MTTLPEPSPGALEPVVAQPATAEQLQVAAALASSIVGTDVNILTDPIPPVVNAAEIRDWFATAGAGFLVAQTAVSGALTDTALATQTCVDVAVAFGAAFAPDTDVVALASSAPDGSRERLQGLYTSLANTLAACGQGDTTTVNELRPDLALEWVLMERHLLDAGVIR